MSAPIRNWIWRRAPLILRVLGAKKQQNGSIIKFLLPRNILQSQQTCKSNRLSEITRVLWFGSSTGCKQTTFLNESFVSLLPVTSGSSQRTLGNRKNNFSTNGGSSQSPQGDEENHRPLKLMDFPELIWPHPLKGIRNLFLSFLIGGYMDRDFSSKKFIAGAEQAFIYVAGLISQGKFDDLDGLVTKEAIQEIQHNYKVLNVKQQQQLAVDPKDLFYRFIYEIGMIFDDKTDQRFVEITTVFHGYHDLASIRQTGQEPMELRSEMKKAEEQLFVCNYRFIREYTKEIAEATDWTINKLNHFSPRDIVRKTDLFSR